MTVPTAGYWGVGGKYATGVTTVKKISERENISIGTWNVRTLRPAGKLEELTIETDRYQCTYWASVKCAGRTLVRCLLMTGTRFISVERRTDMRMGFVF